MFTVSVDSDIKQALKRLDNFDRRQIAFVVAKALTNTAQDAQSTLYDTMRGVFDRPAPYTMGNGDGRSGALFIRPATKQRLEALVKVKDESFKGIPAVKYLAAQMFGGARKMKRSERSLMLNGYIRDTERLIPGNDFPLDAYGNVRGRDMSRILSQLKASSDPMQNETAASKKRAKSRKTAQPRVQYFVGSPGTGGRLPRGIWERRNFKNGSAIRPAFLIVDSTSYKRRLDFQGIVVKVIQRRFDQRLREAMEYAMATSRK